jgi:hypothetical protein
MGSMPIPYEGEKDGYSFSFISSSSYGRLNDYLLRSPDGMTIRLGDLTPQEAYKMSQDPSSYYAKAIDLMSSKPAI